MYVTSNLLWPLAASDLFVVGGFTPRFIHTNKHHTKPQDGRWWCGNCTFLQACQARRLSGGCPLMLVYCFRCSLVIFANEGLMVRGNHDFSEITTNNPLIKSEAVHGPKICINQFWLFPSKMHVNTKNEKHITAVTGWGKAHVTAKLNVLTPRVILPSFPAHVTLATAERYGTVRAQVEWSLSTQPISSETPSPVLKASAIADADRHVPRCHRGGESCHARMGKGENVSSRVSFILSDSFCNEKRHIKNSNMSC